MTTHPNDLEISVHGWAAQATQAGLWSTPLSVQDPDDLPEHFVQQRLGEILVAEGLLDAESCERALIRQRECALPFGECCLSLGLIERPDLSRALARQFGHLHSLEDASGFSKELVMVSHPFGVYAESLRTVINRLMSHWVREECKILAIISAEPGEGRSHVAANLAVGLAQAGWRTLLVDADLRHPKQHLIFDVPQHPGLSRLLCGFAPREVAHRPTALPGLTLVTAGPTPPNPLELLGRKALAEFMKQAGDYHDVIVIDTPAGARFPDAELIAAAASSALMVVRRHRTRQRKVQHLLGSLARHEVNLAGTLMNWH